MLKIYFGNDTINIQIIVEFGKINAFLRRNA
jgi:hypothetical protein